jgi:hypothetical protein
VGDPCTGASRCQAGLVCFEGLCATEAPSSELCTPATHVPDVQDMGTLALAEADYDEPGLDCVAAVRPVVPGLTADSLGVHPVGTQVEFTIPVDTASFSIVSQESPATSVGDTVTIDGFVYANAPVPTDVRLPGGGLFYDDMDSWFTSPDRISGLDAYAYGFAPQAGAFTHPSTSAGVDRLYTAGGAEAGAWRLTVNDYARACQVSQLAQYCDAGGSLAGDYDVTVIRKPGPITSTGTLDLSLYFVSDPLARDRVTLAEVIGSDGFQRYLASLQGVFAQAGVCLGSVKVHELPAWAVDRWGSVDVDDPSPCGELSQLFTTSAGENAVHVFLVDALVSASTGGNMLAGIDGSIPGPSGVPGTIVSGAAVALGALLDSTGGCGTAYDPSSCDPDFLAYVTAHEAGHWLGLFHVTEVSGGYWDPLDDTATCDCGCIANPLERSACASGAGPLYASSCLGDSSCGGGDNLMFWLFQQDVSVGELSPEQGRVMRLNPAVR